MEQAGRTTEGDVHARARAENHHPLTQVEQTEARQREGGTRGGRGTMGRGMGRTKNGGLWGMGRVWGDGLIPCQLLGCSLAASLTRYAINPCQRQLLGRSLSHSATLSNAGFPLGENGTAQPSLSPVPSHPHLCARGWGWWQSLWHFQTSHKNTADKKGN